MWTYTLRLFKLKTFLTVRLRFLVYSVNYDFWVNNLVQFILLGFKKFSNTSRQTLYDLVTKNLESRNIVKYMYIS